MAAHNFRDLSNLPFGRLTVVGQAGRDKFKRVVWECRCRCGVMLVVSSSNLVTGNTQSCGCLTRELAAARLTRPMTMAEVAERSGTPYWKLQRRLSLGWTVYEAVVP